MSSSVATNSVPSSRIALEPRLHLAHLRVGEQPGRVQPARVDERRLAVVREQLAVVGAQEAGDLGGQVGLDAGRPERHTAAPFRSRAAASSASSAAIWTKPSAASCGKISPAP